MSSYHPARQVPDELEQRFNLVTTGMCIDVLLRDRRRNGKLCVLQRVHTGCVLFMLGNSILDAILQLDLTMRTFVTYTGPGGPSAALVGPAYKLGQLQNVPYALQTVVGDALLIHRTYAVYGHDWKILVAFVPAYLVVVVLVCSLAINVAATSLIAIKLVKVLKSRSQFTAAVSSDLPRAALPSDRKFRQLLRIAIESGVLYAVTVLAFVVTFLVRDPISHMFSGLVIMNTAIAFNLIIIRVYRNRAEDAGSGETSGTPSIAFREQSMATCAALGTLSSRTDPSSTAGSELEGAFSAVAEKV